MPRYWFHVPFKNEPLAVDLTGEDAAWGEAVTYLGELLRDIDGQLASPARLSVQVNDGSREIGSIEVTAIRRPD